MIRMTHKHSFSLHPTTPSEPGVPPARQRGVLLIHTGSPDEPTPPALRRYLTEFLSDPAVIQLPAGLGFFQKTLGWLIGRFRAKYSASLYRKIWTERGSPLVVTTAEQAKALAGMLPADWRVFVAMRYGQPNIAKVLHEIEASGIEELVVVPMFPHFSRTTTGSVVQELYRTLRRFGDHLNVSTRTTWYDDIGYIHAQARQLADFATAHELNPQNAHLVFSAHGLPVSYIQRGDPYARQVARTFELVTQRLGWPAERASLCFQSRLGPAEWIGPESEAHLRSLLEQGERRLLVCPISFTADCLETLEEIGERYRKTVESNGGELHLCPALNTYEPFIAALKNLVLRGPQPLTSWGPNNAPLLAATEEEQPPEEGEIESLVMVGASLKNRVGAGEGPPLRYSPAENLNCVKKTHDQVCKILKSIRDDEAVEEALVWNTCHRFEFYAWLKDPKDIAERECVIARVRNRLFGEEPEALAINVLFGREAWHHMMRTVSGLNSGLPGDKDLPKQLQTALRLADHAGTARQRVQHLLDEARRLERGVREETAWGAFEPGYCFAALSRVFEHGADPADARHVIIGGSTTSCSIVETLATRFEVPRRQMALAYRGHKGGQMKQLRAAIGPGRKIRVQDYRERAVLDAIAEADVVYLGIDRDEKLLDAEVLAGLRDFKARPLTVIDFNTLESTRGLETLDGVTLWNAGRLEKEVDAFAEKMCAEDRFAAAVKEAERWIKTKLPDSPGTYLESPCAQRRDGRHPDCRHCVHGLGTEASTTRSAE